MTEQLRYAFSVVESLPEHEQDIIARWILYHMTWNLRVPNLRLPSDAP